MAKNTSVITFSGKMGNIVGSKGQDGKYILRQKTSKVQNPQTKKQIEQRSKISLLSKFNAATPIDAIPSLGYNDAKRRAEFSKINYPSVNIQVDPTSGAVTAQMKRSTLQLSRGAAQRAPLNISKSYADGEVTLTATMATGHTPDEVANMGVYCVIYVMSTDNSTPPRGFYVDIPNPTAETPSQVLTVPVGNIEVASVITYYDVTYVLSNEGRSVRAGILGNTSQLSYNVHMTNELSATITDYSATHFLGVTNVPAPTQG